MPARASSNRDKHGRGLTLAEQNVVLARKPAEAIPGGLAGPGLLAQVFVSKYTDHLPLHRLAPLYEQMKGIVLASHVMHTDDTTSHKRDGPAEFLKDYWGYLQADAFKGYDGIYLESQGRIIEVGCWAHARRKFHECRRLDSARMETALAWIGKLYAVEKDLRGRREGPWQKLTLEEQTARVAAQRQERSRPLLEGFHAWLETEAPKVLPKSPAQAAMDYTLSNWAALSVYPDDGWLDIDNNEGESSLRGLGLGRRNWLFCGSDRGGRAAAVYFSLLASAALAAGNSHPRVPPDAYAKLMGHRGHRHWCQRPSEGVAELHN